MKRSGFVANSSSSSFVCENKVGFSLEQVEAILTELFNMVRNIHIVKYPNDEYFPKTFRDMFKAPFIVEESESPGLYRLYMIDWMYKDDWRLKYMEIKTENDFTGKLIINSTGDNTIPCELFELIEWTFDGYRIHLG